jgi:hypothetical protein
VREQDFRHSRRRDFDADSYQLRPVLLEPDPDSASPGLRPRPGHLSVGSLNGSAPIKGLVSLNSLMGPATPSFMEAC